MLATREAELVDYLETPDEAVKAELHPRVRGLAAQATILASYEGELTEGQRAWLDDRFSKALAVISEYSVHPAADFMEVRNSLSAGQDAWSEETLRLQKQGMSIGFQSGVVPEALVPYINKW